MCADAARLGTAVGQIADICCQLGQAQPFIYRATGAGLLTALAAAAGHESAALARLVRRASLTSHEGQQLRTFLLQASLPIPNNHCTMRHAIGHAHFSSGTIMSAAVSDIQTCPLTSFWVPLPLQKCNLQKAIDCLV